MPLGARDVLFVLRAQDFASRQIRSVAGSFGTLGKQMETFRRQGAEKVSNVQRNLIRQQRDLAEGHRQYLRPLQAENAALRTRNSAIGESIARGQLEGKQLKAARIERAANTATMARNAQQIDVVNDAHRREGQLLKRKADDYIRGYKRIAQANQDAIMAQRALSQATVASGARMVTTGAIMAAVGVAAIAGMGAMAQASANFRQQVALAQTQAEDVEVGVGRVGASIADLEQVAFRVGAAVPVPLEQLSQGLYDIFSSIDVNLEGGRKLLTQFAQDAVAGQVDLEDASRANIAVMNAWGRGAEGVVDISDTMFRLVERGIGTYGEFTGAIGRAIPATVRSGQEFETLGASMAFLTRQGLSAEQAATSTARAFELLADPRVVEDLEAIGVQMTDTQGNFMPMVDILEQISDRWGHLPAPERAAQMMEVFSGAGYRIQARRFLDTVIPGFDKFNTEVERMSDRAGAAQRAYNTMFAQPKSQIQLLVNNLKILVYEIGENFFGVINKVVSVVIGFVDKLRSIDPRLVSLMTGFLSITATVLAFGGALRILIGLATMAKGAFIAMIPAQIGVALASYTSNAAMAAAASKGLIGFLTTPWGIAFAAAAIAVVGVVAALKRLDAQTEASTGMAERLAGSVDAAFVAVEDMSGEIDEGGASLAKFRRENQLTAKQLKEMGNEAARMRLIEIGVQLKYRSDLEPDEIEQHLQRLAQQAGIVLDVPIRFSHLEGITAVRSAMNKAMADLADTAGAEQAWGTLNRSVHNVKEQLDSVSDLAVSSFIGGGRNVEEFASAIDHMRTSIEDSGAPIEAQINALNHLSDVMGQGFGDVNTDNIKDFESMLKELYDQTLISKSELIELQIALGMDTGYTAAELSARRHEAALADIPSAAGAAGDAAGAAGDDFSGLADDVEDATSALQDHQDQLLASVSPMFKAINAQRDYEQSLIDIEEAQKAVDEAENAEERAAAMRDLEQAHIDSAEQMFTTRAAVAGMLDETDNLILSAEGLRSAMEEVGIPQHTIDAIMGNAELVLNILDDLATERGIDLVLEPEKVAAVSRGLRSITDDTGNVTATADQAKRILNEIGVDEATIAELGNDTQAMLDLINQVAKEHGVDVNVTTHNVDAIAYLESRLRAVTGKTWQVRVDTTTTNTYVRRQGVSGWIPEGTSHEGGWAGDFSGIGNLADLKSDEIPSILQKGEYVLSRKMVAQLKDVMRFHEGGYVVEKGDTLSGIAQKQMGDASLWKQIHEANQGKIGHPDLIFPGQKFVIPHGHKGSGGGSSSGGGRTRVQRTRDILAAGGSSGEIQAAIDKVNKLHDAWNKAEEAAKLAKQRAALVKDIRAAEDAKERREATKALKEWDREQAIAKRNQIIQAQLVRAEARKQIALNREQWQFERMTTQEQLANVEKRLSAERRFTDEWMSLANQRQQLLEEIADRRRAIQQEQLQEAEAALSESEAAYDEALGSLNSMLDERESILEQMGDREKQYAEAVKEAQEDITESIKDAVESRRQSLQSEFDMTGGDILSAGGYADLAKAQNEQIEEWHQGLLELQRRGLSADVIEAMGLADSPDQLEAVRNILGGSVDELDNLNRAIADRQAILNTIVEEESTNTMFDLANSLEQLKIEHQHKLAELQQEFNDDMAALNEQLAAVGADNGRTWAEAIAQGIASGIPAIEKQVAEVQRLMREMKAAEAAADEARNLSGSEADIRRIFEQAGAIIATSSESAAERIKRISTEVLSGQRSIEDVQRDVQTIARIQSDVRAAFQQAGVAISGHANESADERIARIAQELINGQRTMKQLQQDLATLAASAQTYDSGGVLKPGVTLAYNRTGHNERVVGPNESGGVIVKVEEGAFQFNGPIDSATIPDVQRLLNEFVDELADELRSN